ncbi:UNVERIFIED_CONTAM: hypothetical protein HDU68_003691 [Siphonaria sp. JEL0065]|nr:hypothetical protein HDU68_003691 [Siphonaria sp. JEL0065]
MEEYTKKVAVLFKLKAQGGLLPLRLLQEAFIEVANLDATVLHDGKDGVRLHLAESLFEQSTNKNEQQQQKFISPKEFDVLIEKKLHKVAIW